VLTISDTTDMKKERSKSARIIKSIYKKLNMKEETYDWEKDDKSSQEKSYGKTRK
jgi:molybdopterin biosynthesis enzyme MoaB